MFWPNNLTSGDLSLRNSCKTRNKVFDEIIYGITDVVRKIMQKNLNVQQLKSGKNPDRELKSH